MTAILVLTRGELLVWLSVAFGAGTSTAAFLAIAVVIAVVNWPDLAATPSSSTAPDAPDAPDEAQP